MERPVPSSTTLSFANAVQWKSKGHCLRIDNHVLGVGFAANGDKDVSRHNRGPIEVVTIHQETHSSLVQKITSMSKAGRWSLNDGATCAQDPTAGLSREYAEV